MEKTQAPIILGSGTLYSMLIEDIKTFKLSTITNAIIEKAENIFGAIKGGATLNYDAKRYTAVDDMGKVKKSKATEEPASFKAGIITINPETIFEMCNTARVGEETEDGTEVKIGGLDNYKDKYYLYRFVYKDAVDGDIRVTFIGNNSVGLAFAFNPDKETQFNPEFEPFPFLDDEGTLFIILFGKPGVTTTPPTPEL